MLITQHLFLLSRYFKTLTCALTSIPKYLKNPGSLTAHDITEDREDLNDMILFHRDATVVIK